MAAVTTITLRLSMMSVPNADGHGVHALSRVSLHAVPREFKVFEILQFALYD